MAMNIGGGYPMMGGMNSMTSYNMPMMGSVPQNVIMKYGCEDCFRKEPYPCEFPKPYMRMPQDFRKQSFWQRLMHNIFGE